MEKVAYLKGVLADGHVYERNDSLRIVVRQTDKEWLQNEIFPILQGLSRREPRIIQTNDGVYSLWVYTSKKHLSKEIVEILLRPLDEVEFSNEIERLAFIKGFFEAEGSVYINKKKKNDIRIIMYQKNPKVLFYIKRALEEYGIQAKIYGPYKNGKNSIFRLIVFTKKNSVKFLKTINPSPHSKFRTKISSFMA